MAQTPHDAAMTQEPPYGATVVVYRRTTGGIEFLVLHRGPRDPDFADDWAWGPPSGGRHPGEALDRCAARELREETGLRLLVRRTGAGSPDWAVYRAEAPYGSAVTLSSEHDAYRWLPLARALALVTPAVVRAGLARAAQEIPEGVGTDPHTPATGP